MEGHLVGALTAQIDRGFDLVTGSDRTCRLNFNPATDEIAKAFAVFPRDISLESFGEGTFLRCRGGPSIVPKRILRHDVDVRITRKQSFEVVEDRRIRFSGGDHTVDIGNDLVHERTGARLCHRLNGRSQHPRNREGSEYEAATVHLK